MVQEMECNVCHSNFVECTGQEVESFLGNSSNGQPESSSEGDRDNGRESIDQSPNSGGEIIHQILNRVLGVGVQVRPQTSSTLLTVMQNAAAESGRPIGIVVRQAVSSDELESLASMLSSGSRRSALVGGGEIGGSFGALGNLLSLPSLGGGGGGGGGTSGIGLGLGGQSFDDLLHHILMHETSHAGAPPATQEVIDNLPHQLVEDEDAAMQLGECSISQEMFSIGDTAVTLPCGHFFKQDLVVQWLKMHDTCPVCRVRLSSSCG